MLEEAQNIINQISKQKKRNWLWIGFCLGSVSMVSALGGAWLALSLSATPLLQTELTSEEEAVFNQEETVSQRNLNIPKLNRPLNILVLGTKVLTSDLEQPPEQDLGYHALVNSFDGLADSMLLIRFDPSQEKLNVVSIPRDTKIYLEGVGETKINAANYYGGPALSAKSVSNLLAGVSIDRYVRVNVQGVEKLIDALGGVTVYVPQDMKYTDHSQHLYIDLKKGIQHLDGDQAVQFLRFRYDEFGDIGRVQRQQLLMRALVEQALQPKTLLRTQDILSVIQANIDTNLTVDELIALAGFASKTKRSQVQMLMLPGDFNGDGREQISYWLPNEKEIDKMMAKYFAVGYEDYEYINPASVRVAIQDGTGDLAAVQGVISYLAEAGYSQVYMSEEYQEPLDVTKIIAQKGDDGNAAAIRATLGVGEVLVESTGSLASDITIQLGPDWQEKYTTSIH
ncbi:MAG: LCP family protein [Gomphosphaeria aponina SAG 52.96 = DSM 107014]|uniref:LCP family protein n=1 Tax=Gomphosphaeria aponina SAG 52.96 = DSM 107014 TaxID=1521640 RepID=A0A941JPP5_9CHRO|nr:LCP family protein [Gomphosphaeria aponina SAG 52.96 = DSM 107014]